MNVVRVGGLFMVIKRNAKSILEAIILVCFDKLTYFLTMKFDLSWINLMTPISSSPFVSISNSTESPTAIGLVLFIPFILNLPLILHW